MPEPFFRGESFTAQYPSPCPVIGPFPDGPVPSYPGMIDHSSLPISGAHCEPIFLMSDHPTLVIVVPQAGQVMLLQGAPL
jgi:hypothetical protein